MSNASSNLAANGTDHPFVHLRVHSAYSILEGAIQISTLVDLCKENDMPAVAITDSANLYAALEFSTKLFDEGIQPIIGCAVNVVPERLQLPRYWQAGLRPPPLVFLAQSEAGYRNLINLVSGTYDDPEAHFPYATLATVEECSEELICLTGGPHGLIGESFLSHGPKRTKELVSRLASVFPDRLYVELQRHGSENQKHVKSEAVTEPLFLSLAYDQDLLLPLVATNEAYFPDQGFFEAHDTLRGISPSSLGVPREGRITPEHYFKSGAEMHELFGDLPEAVENTIEIAQRCSYWPAKQKPMLPTFTTDDSSDEIMLLRDKAHDGLRHRLSSNPPMTAPEQEYHDRLEFELKVITEMNFAGYFLIVADFVGWAKGQKIPVGPGRGSGAGSLVAYALQITDLDPIRYGLLFERFLNPERISMPDFDIDFCEDRRDEVLQYVRERWGADHVAKIITFGSMQARAAIRDVGRALGVPLPVCDRIAKTIPANPANPITLSEAKETVPEFQEELAREQSGQKLYEIAAQLEGLPRNASIHAAGIVIGNRPLRETVPLWRESKSEYPATQFSMSWAEAAGLVKFDFLGLKTLTALQETVDRLQERGVELDLGAIPLDDPGVFELLSKANTAGVFQVEGDGMRDMLRQLKPDRFEDIIALVALYRPGPMANIPEYCEIKHGKKQATYLHPELEPILSETYGIIVYQEQVMEIARHLAGYSLGEADVLRRAMGKKKPEEMKKMRSTFLKGLKDKSGLTGENAKEMFDLVAKFAEYGFNKSHAAAYALISYQTAFLKVRHTADFLAATMNTELYGQDEKLAKLRNEAIVLGVNVPPPCVNRSFAKFRAIPVDGQDDKFEIPFALGAVKGVSSYTVSIIEDARDAGGPFKSLGDFASRVALKELGKKAVEGLARAGALDAIVQDRNRRQVVESVPALLQYSEDHHRDNGGAGISLFGSAELETSDFVPVNVNDYTSAEKYQEERAAIGFLVSGHPLDDYASELNLASLVSCKELEQEGKPDPNKMAVVSVDNVKFRRSQRGQLYAQIVVSDTKGSCTMMMFDESLARNRDKVKEGNLVALSLEVTDDVRGRSIICRSVVNLEDYLKQYGKSAKSGTLTENSLESKGWEPLSEVPVFDKMESLEDRGESILSVHLCGEDENVTGILYQLRDALDGVKAEDGDSWNVRVQILHESLHVEAATEGGIMIPKSYLMTDQTLDRIRHVAGVLSAELTKGTVQ